VTHVEGISGFRFRDEVIPSHGYMLPVLRDIIREECGAQPQRIFELGCGKGDMAASLARDGHSICGVDPSPDGIALAQKHYPDLDLALGSSDDDLVSRFGGGFTVALSVDVIEYAFHPRHFARTIHDLLVPGGLALVTAPYHGYLKNVAIAVSGSMDRHFNALQPFGRIKFWSMETLRTLLEEVGFRSIRFRRVGRVPPLAKAMIAIARK
jgi:SAM-dependent methyltransferase